jgi:hypothetical protein
MFSSRLYIEERVFGNFFNNDNILHIENNTLNCSDKEQFRWILTQKSSLKNKLFASCSDGSDIWDSGLYSIKVRINFTLKTTSN